MKPTSLALAALLLASVVRAQDSRPPAELVEVRRRVAALETSLKQLEQQQAAAGKERERIDTELALATMRVKEGEAALAELAAAESAAADSAAAAQERLRAASETLRAQLGLLAVFGRVGLLPMVLHALSTEQDLQRRITVTLAIVEEHKRRRDEIATLLDERTAALSTLSRRREDALAGRQELDARRRDLEATKLRCLAELARLEGQRRTGAAALAEARESEGRLERLWGNVLAVPEVEAGNVRLLRGGLPWPVSWAQVIRPFGAVRDPRYGTKTVSNGVILMVPPGEEVHAIARGKVVFAQYFKGYGNLVIVDHGTEVYSLYAQLASMFPHTGQRVAMNEPVGIAGRGEGQAGNLYLEIRVGKSPQNPLLWLKPLKEARPR